MKNKNSQNSTRVRQSKCTPAVTVFELTDPSTAGDNFEILDQDIVHLDSRPFSAKRAVIQLESSVLIFHSSSHRTRSSTKLPPGMMAFLVIGPSSRAKVDGLALNPSTLLAGEPGIEKELVVEAGYESITLLISPKELIQHLRRRRRRQTFKIQGGIELWHSNQGEFRGLFDIGKRLTEIAFDNPELINANDKIRTAAHIELLEWLLSTLQKVEQSPPSRTELTNQRYSQIVEVAQQYVMKHHSMSYSVSDICEVTATSERTLQYAFRKILGMTPTEYLIRMRLHQVRQDLLQANKESATVTRIAVNWGFWHLGEFSNAYKRCFNERPSQTLSRAGNEI